MSRKYFSLLLALALSGCAFQVELVKPESACSQETGSRRAEIDSLRVELARAETREFKNMLIQLYSEPTIKAAIDSVYPFNKLSNIKP